MQHFFPVTVCICLAVAFQLLGCAENTDDETMEEMDSTSLETIITEPIQTKPTPEGTFEKLKTLFPKPIFDEEFTTLGEVATSKTYLDFLAQEYRTEKPFKTLAAYLDVAQPDPERYTPFLKEFIKKPNEEDTAMVHQMTLRYRCGNATLYQMMHGGNNVLQGILAVLEKKLGILEEAPIQAWLEFRIPDPDQVKDFFAAFENFVRETEKTDTLFIQEQIEEHGKDNGILWVALRNPALTAEVLNNFTDTAVFLRWIDGDFFVEEP